MSTFRRIAFAVSVSWLGRFSVVLSGLILTPILFRFLNKEELGIWYLLNSSQSFLGLLGLGIIPTLTRHIALAKGTSGADPSVELTKQSQQHIGDLFVTGKMILRSLAGVIFLIGWIGGYILINQIKFTEVSQQEIILVWTLLCAGYAVGVGLSYLGCLLTGMGYVGWDSLIGMTTYFLTVVCNIIVVLLGGRLLSLAVISALACLIQVSIMLGLIRWRFPELLNLHGNWNRQYAQALFKPSLYWWLTDLGAFLVLRTDGYFIALFQGTENLPSYQAAYNLVANLFQLAIAFAASTTVFISQAWTAGSLETIQRMTLRNSRIGLSIMAAGVAFLMVAGKEFIELWLGQGNFVGYKVLLTFCIMLTLETQHVILVASSRATEDEKYAPSALSAGVLNVILTWILIKPLGLLGVALGTMLSQMLSNNWYAVYRPMVRLRLNFGIYCRQAVGLWAVVLVCCLSLSWLVKQSLWLLGINSSWVVIIATASVCVAVFSIASWMNILEEHHRRSIQSKWGGWLR